MFVCVFAKEYWGEEEEDEREEEKEEGGGGGGGSGGEGGVIELYWMFDMMFDEWMRSFRAYNFE